MRIIIDHFTGLGYLVHLVRNDGVRKSTFLFSLVEATAMADRMGVTPEHRLHPGPDVPGAPVSLDK